MDQQDVCAKEKVAEAGWEAERDLDERDWERCSSHRLCSTTHFQLMSSINFMLPVFEKLYKYAEQSDDKFLSQATASKGNYQVTLRSRQILMAFIIVHRRTAGTHL
ncbi:hypothetical protein AMECASPLE_033319 [Ameca splendens]|uniref:Uncharacterized protein n=1 Tax=Ameca splendens TaxID=208324 RepID=A0ABV0YV26_9TELE